MRTWRGGGRRYILHSKWSVSCFFCTLDLRINRKSPYYWFPNPPHKSRLGNLTGNHPAIGFLFKIQGEPVTNGWVRSFRMFWQRSWYVHFFTVSQPWHRPFCHRNKTPRQSIWCWTHSHDMSRGNKAGQDKGRNKTDQRDRYHLIDWSVKTWLGGKKDW